MTLTPAYGRDYKSVKEVKAAWEANADFVIADMFHPDSGRYVNKEQLPNEKRVGIRFNRLTKIAFVQ